MVERTSDSVASEFKIITMDACFCMSGVGRNNNLAALIQYITLPDPGRNRPRTFDVRRKMAVRTLSREPPGEGGGKK